MKLCQLIILVGWPAFLVYMMMLETRPCPTVTPIPDFKFTDYYGMWHEMYSTKGMHEKGECHSSKYTDRGTFVSVITASWTGTKPNQRMSR